MQVRHHASFLPQDLTQRDLAQLQQRFAQQELSQRIKVRDRALMHLLDPMCRVRVQHHLRSARGEHSLVQASHRARQLLPDRSWPARVHQMQRFAQPVIISR
jgi:hypothetical protein